MVRWKEVSVWALGPDMCQFPRVSPWYKVLWSLNPKRLQAQMFYNR